MVGGAEGNGRGIAGAGGGGTGRWTVNELVPDGDGRAVRARIDGRWQDVVGARRDRAEVADFAGEHQAAAELQRSARGVQRSLRAVSVSEGQAQPAGGGDLL